MQANLVFRLLLIFLPLALYSQSDKKVYPNDLKIPAKLRFIRVFGGNNEKNPPILLISQNARTYDSPLAQEQITIEFDVLAYSAPRFYLKIVHCKADWTETDNSFINNPMNRVSFIDWAPAFVSSGYFSQRGRVSLPNSQMRFQYSGNYKAYIIDMDTEENVGEVRFFVVKPLANSQLIMDTDLYNSNFNTSKTSLIMNVFVSSREPLIDANIKTTVIYKNHRWFEPWIISNDNSIERKSGYRYKTKDFVGGFSAMGKNFRLEGLPTENGYRILDLLNTTFYTSTPSLQRINFNEIPRNGSFMFSDDDGAMFTNNLPQIYDDYCYIEFTLDPLNIVVTEDLFVVGSFNNWKANKDWMMIYDSNERLYKLRQWVRRGRHSYLFSVGTLDLQENRIYNYSYDQLEGNTSYTGHTYLALTYYREIQDGGYDALIAISAANIYGEIRR
jgi:hypothetical protein